MTPPQLAVINGWFIVKVSNRCWWGQHSGLLNFKWLTAAVTDCNPRAIIQSHRFHCYPTPVHTNKFTVLLLFTILKNRC